MGPRGGGYIKDGIKIGKNLVAGYEASKDVKGEVRVFHILVRRCLTLILGPHQGDEAQYIQTRLLYGPNQVDTQVDFGALKANTQNTMGIFAGDQRKQQHSLLFYNYARSANSAFDLSATVTVSGGFTPSDWRRKISFDK